MRFMMIVKTRATGRDGWWVKYSGEIQSQSKADAMEWVRHFPSQAVDRKELVELDDPRARRSEAA